MTTQVEVTWLKVVHCVFLQVLIEAADNGSPAPLSTQLTITIFMLDANDNLPEFTDVSVNCGMFGILTIYAGILPSIQYATFIHVNV